MSGGSSSNNSWTILTPEESAAETLRPLAEGTEHHEKSFTSAEGSCQAVNGARSAVGLPVDSHLVSEEKSEDLSGDKRIEQHPLVSTDAPHQASLDVSGSPVPSTDLLSQSEGLPEGLAQSCHDPDSFSDSYTHITPSPDEPTVSVNTETLGRVECSEEEERISQDGTQYPLNGEGLLHEDLDLFLRTTDIGKQADFPVDSPEHSKVDEEGTVEEGEPEVRRRRSLLAALERIGRAEEEEEREEEFQLPQREEDSGFSVNKCILGAVILLGLGTIFFSESDYGTMELKDPELPGKQEWLNPEVPPPPVDADNRDLLNKLAEGNQQISVLQAELQAQKEEIKVAKGEAAVEAEERLHWEEVEKENTGETPVKSTMLPPCGQPGDSTQDTTGATEDQDTKPWHDQREKKENIKIKKEKEWKERAKWRAGGKKERKDEVKTEWQEGKLKQGKFEKERAKEDKQKKYSEENKQWKEKDRKKEKSSRGDDGKSWKDREGKKERTEKSERKESKEEKVWKNVKNEKGNDGKQWKSKEDKRDWKVRKEDGGKYKGMEEWKGEREWKKGRDGYKESGKEKWEKKDWKEKGEKKEWKKEVVWKSKNSKESRDGKGERKHWVEGKKHDKEGKDERKHFQEDKSHSKDRKWKDESRHWNKNEWKSKKSNDDKEWKRKDVKKQWGKEEQWKREQKENKHNRDLNKDTSGSQKHKDENRFNGNHGHKEEHVWGDRKPPHTHHPSSLEQPKYWAHQKDRLQHNPKPHEHCYSLETCAQAEGLIPVHFTEFSAILQTYLAKAEEAGVDSSKREELQKLTKEFFKDGVFVHNQLSFLDFVEDMEDILEDMVEAYESNGEEEDEEDSTIEEEMEGFDREVMKKFSVPGAGDKEERSKGEWRKESGQACG